MPYVNLSAAISVRANSIKPSPTLAVAQKAAELKAQGIDIIGLGTGEPDFDTPDHIKQAAIDAIGRGKTKYTAVDGIPELKAAVIDKFKRDNGLTYQPNQILVSCGGKQSFFNLALALLNSGDEVIIPAPYWVSYPDIVLIADGKPVILPTDHHQQFKITAAQLEKAITPKTKLVVLNSPSNPTGVAYRRQEWQAIAEVLLKHPDIFVATDDMYEHILWSEEPFSNILNVCPELYSRTFVLNGVSKAYAMTGWRIGYAGGPKELIGAMNKVQSQSTSNPTSISQYAACEALNGPQDCITMMTSAFKQRHDYLLPQLNAISGISCTPSDGTFYAFASFHNMIQQAGFANDVELCERLISDVRLALVPGSAFGAEGYVRLSYATSMKVLEQAVERLQQASEMWLK